MKTLVASIAVAGVAISLSACVYYPDGPYGPGYGPYHRPPAQESAPPPPSQGGYGPQNGGYDGAPPDNYGPPPNGGPSDQDQGYGPQSGGPDQDDMSAGPDGKADKAMSKINNPNWCAKHQKKCDKLRARYGQPDQQMGPPGDQQPPEQ